MSYQIIDRRSDLNVKQDDMLASKRFVIERKPDVLYFYELEEAVVLDIILDESHPEFRNVELDPADWPPNIDGSEPVTGGPNYAVMGAIKFRFLNSQIGVDKEVLNWAVPMENTGITEFPLLNEVVVVGKYLNKFFYTKKINSKSVVNTNADFGIERVSGYGEPDAPEGGPISKLNFKGGDDYEGVLGKYFKFNAKIRAIRRYEGDTILESRFGSSIRFGAYDDNRKNDNGVDDYSDGGGNPMILIRNHQAPVKGSDGFTAKGYTAENVNEDGTSIHITSGKTVSKFIPTTKLPFINISRPMKIPPLDGNQILMNSGRLVFSSRDNETLFFSKKDYGITTDTNFSVTADRHLTFSSYRGIVTFNARKIYLGLDKTGPNDQPIILGGELVAWLNAMCNALANSLNNQIAILTTLIAHNHVATGPKSPTTPPMPQWIAALGTQIESTSATQQQLIMLRTQLATLQSSRVFVAK